jgi:serine/threonine protein phosphatase PrpC
MLCPACATELPDDDLFCESCGVSLQSANPPSGDCKCGASPAQVDDDGFCTRCGRRVKRPASDHIEESLSNVFAAVSDRGIRHDRNEDRFGLWMSEEHQAIVVCDGVSATRNSEIASSTVAEETVASLSNAFKHGPVEDPESAMRNAIKSGAAKLAARMPKDEPESAPSTTVVAALLDGSEVILGWVGDSRAYWIDPAGATPLTRDHSWVNDVVAAGQMSVAEAEASPRAHGITRWIGADADADLNPEIARHRIEGPGTLLLCTDGLWNYAKTNEAMGNLLREASVYGQDALEIARRLVHFANDQGGQDNITAAVLRFP